MLNEQQKDKKLSGITASDAVIILQVIARLIEGGGVRDVEMTVSAFADVLVA